LELLDLDLDSESCSFSGLGLDLAVAGLDTSLLLVFLAITLLQNSNGTPSAGALNTRVENQNHS